MTFVYSWCFFKNLMKYVFFLIITFFISCWTNLSFGSVKVSSVFGDNMVLQSEVKTRIWGTADPGERVLITIGGQISKTQADSLGHWNVHLDAHKAGGPHELKVVGDTNKLVFNNVYFGDVWLCAGQANMSFPLKKVFNASDEISFANYSRIRVLTISEKTSESPLNDIVGQWEVCSPKTAKDFSAIAYYFGRNLYETLKSPIGLIVLASKGGSTCESWAERSELEKYSSLRSLLDSNRNLSAPPFQRTGALYNGMVAPICPFSIKGVIWYQGESNTSRAFQYQTLFPAFIRSWRNSWNQGDFPFYYVQLPNFMKVSKEPTSSAWAELREAQHKALAILPNTGEVVSIDVGDEKSLFPQNKEIIGSRLALLALAKTYQCNIPCSGPVFQTKEIVDGSIILSFDNAENGLIIQKNKYCDNSVLKGFEIAGEDQKFYWAKAEIQKDKVVVSSSNVPSPVAVRYAWANNPVCNLGNKEGFPASPFRTDSWPGCTTNAQ